MTEVGEEGRDMKQKVKENRFGERERNGGVRGKWPGVGSSWRRKFI
jgi:hypothetical protein